MLIDQSTNLSSNKISFLCCMNIFIILFQFTFFTNKKNNKKTRKTRNLTNAMFFLTTPPNFIPTKLSVFTIFIWRYIRKMMKQVLTVYQTECNFKTMSNLYKVCHNLHWRTCDDAPRLDPVASSRVRPAYDARKRPRDRSSAHSSSESHRCVQLI
jgi:tRNA U38,U39,U40 pseudouridine synthase TruA